MANGTTIPAPGTTPQVGGLNYEDYRKRITEAAAKTREVTGPKLATPGIWQNIHTTERTLGGFGAQAGGLMRAAVDQYQAQYPEIQKRAEKAASALEMVGGSALAGVKNLENIQESIRQQVQSASGTWDAAAEKADEYVKAARGRVGEVLGKLDSIFEDIRTTRDFSKAHAMQASVQAVTGSMKNEERNIVQTYGTDSKEYEQFRMSKANTLATVQSNIHATYAQLEEQQKITFLNATSEAYTKSNMYVGFQEQQHVEMLKFRDENRQAYALKAAELDASLEQMKMTGMENLANWMIETPTFTMDTSPLIAAISDLSQTAVNQFTSWKLYKTSRKTGGSQELLTQLGTAAAVGAGTAFGGPLGGMAAGAAMGGLTKKKKTGGGFGTTE